MKSLRRRKAVDVKKLVKILKGTFVGLIFAWFLISAVSLYMNCMILETNYNNALDGVEKGIVKEISVEEPDGSFRVFADNTDYYMSEVKTFARSPQYSWSYYSIDEKVFVKPLSSLETRNLILLFGLLDISTLIFLLVFIIKSDGFKKHYIVMVSLYLLYVGISYIVEGYSLDVLYKFNFNYIVFPLVKCALLVFTIFFARLYKAIPDEE